MGLNTELLASTVQGAIKDLMLGRKTIVIETDQQGRKIISVGAKR